MSEHHDTDMEYGAHGREAHSRAHGDGQDEILSRKEVANFTKDAFSDAGRNLANAKIGENKKFMGISMDAGIVDMLNGAYNFGADYASTELRPKVFSIVEKVAPHIGLGPKATKSAAAAAMIVSTAALKMGNYFGAIYSGVSSQVKERKELARKISPVLDELKGSHSLAAFYGVSKRDNEIIFSHRQRMGRIAKTENLVNVIDLGINSGTSLLFDSKSFHGIWKDREILTASNVNRLRIAQPNGAPASHTAVDHSGGFQVMKAGILGMLPKAAERLSAISQYKLHKELQPYDALEMILELNEQVATKPDARTFEVPRSFQEDNHHRKEYPLEEYLMRICIQHQKDMADIDPQHSEIREALREDLAAAVKPIAAAIRAGDLSVMSLMRMVGGGIVKKQGRGIASHEEVEALIAKEAPKQSSYTQRDPAEHYKNASYSRDTFKSRLNGFEGEKRLMFASIFPNSVLADAGMSKKEIKQVEAYRSKGSDGKGYDHEIAYQTLGLNSKLDEIGDAILAKNEMKKVSAAAEQIEQYGVAAVHDLKTSPTHENGIETLLGNVLVHKPEYLGTLMENGRKQFAEIAANDEHFSHVASKDSANDADYGHADRETRRTGTHDAHAAR